MGIQSVLIKKSTGQIIKHGDYPRADMQPVVGLDPDYEYLIKHTPFVSPDYDPRIYILKKVDAITTEAHPEYPSFNIFKTTFMLEKRSDIEIESAIKQAQRLADEAVFRSQEQMTSSVRMLSIMDRQTQGLTITADEETELLALREMRVKIDKNLDNYLLKIDQLNQGLEPEIDEGWEKGL